MGALEGKVAIVTGGASGIGEAMVDRFVAEGARVVVADVSGEQRAVAERHGPMALAVQADVSSSADVQGLVNATGERFGRLDVMCNNAGIAATDFSIVDTPEDEFARVIAVDLTGVFLGMKYGIPLMLESGGGSIVNTSSIAGLVGIPRVGAYAAAKAAVIQLTRVAAVELGGQGVRVNAICPGVVLTPLMRAFRDHDPERAQQAVADQPIARFAEPAEIAALALYLASDEAAFVTGVAFPIDGGYTAH